MTTIQDVAKLAGVSPSTVSKFFNNPGAVKPANYQSIERAVKKLNYTPNMLARNLRVQNSRTVAVIAQEITNPFHAVLYNTIRKKAETCGYSVVLYSASDVGGRLSELFGSFPVSYFSGVIVCYLTDMIQSYDFAMSHPTVPSVVFSNNRDLTQAYPNTASVLIDVKAGVMRAAEHLIGLGMKEIAFLGSSTSHPEHEPKLAAFREVLQKHGLPLSHILNANQDFTALSGYQSAQRLLSMAELPDAIVVASDIMAVGVMRCLTDNGISVPRDILLASCDDIALAAMYAPALTTVRLPIEAASARACELLVELIEKRRPVSDSMVEFFDTELIIRETTRR